jgi:hypothetical protein
MADEVGQWAMLGSNQRPLPCEGGALSKATLVNMRLDATHHS